MTVLLSVAPAAPARLAQPPIVGIADLIKEILDPRSAIICGSSPLEKLEIQHLADPTPQYYKYIIGNK